NVTKVESPAGDRLASFNPAWYEALLEGQDVIVLDLRDAAERRALNEQLSAADLLLTSSRPASLARLGLSWGNLSGRHPRLSQVAIVGYPAPRENEPGHDLTYLAEYGLLTPPEMPRTLLADLAGAERAVSAALGLLFGRERSLGVGYVEVALSEAAESFSAPLAYGITKPDAVLGGGFAGYGVYPAYDGWISVAVLEPHFMKKLVSELGVKESSREAFERIFAEKSSAEWETWARERDLPIVAVRTS
ncbi:MAG: CoA transferase, partial [Rubrobacter sp.]